MKCPVCGSTLAVLYRREKVDKKFTGKVNYFARCPKGNSGCDMISYGVRGDTYHEAIANWAVKYKKKAKQVLEGKTHPLQVRSVKKSAKCPKCHLTIYGDKCESCLSLEDFIYVGAGEGGRFHVHMPKHGR